MRGFANEFFWKSLRDFRAWASVAGLLLAGANGVTGWTLILPTWAWLFIAVACAFAMTVRAEWKSYKENQQKIQKDMPLEALVKRIVGSEDILVGDNCRKTGDALLEIREHAHLGEIAVWGRRDVQTKDLALYPLTSIPPEYWDEFGINYLRFTDARMGESERVRGQPKKTTVQGAVMTTIHAVVIPDVFYGDFWFCEYQVDKIWPRPKTAIKLQWPLRKTTA
jgi:hypothetical protein